jgi:hypothetical protein
MKHPSTSPALGVTAAKPAAASPAHAAAPPAPAALPAASAAAPPAPAAIPDPVSGPVRELLAIFDHDLRDVRFPDVDREALDACARQVLEAAAALARQEAATAAARAALDSCQDALAVKAHRAAAYARVFAEGDPALAARLDAIALPRRATRGAAAASALAAAPVRAPRRRGRPPRARPSDETSLFAAPEGHGAGGIAAGAGGATAGAGGAHDQDSHAGA